MPTPRTLLGFLRSKLQQKKPAIKQPVAAPRAAKKPAKTPAPAAAPKPKPQPTPSPKKEQLNKSPDALLGNAPEDINLLGKNPIEITLNGKKHIIAFKSDGLYLDGIKYTLSAIDALPFGGDAQLSILEVCRKGNELLLKAGALGKEGTVRGDASMIKNIITTLLRGRPFRSETDGGTTVEIEKQMY